MTRFRETFANRHIILPVVHVAEPEQALRNAEITRRQGCDGVFLIRHEIDDKELLRIHHRLFEAFVQVLRALGDRSVVLFIDDVHWADQATLDVVVDHEIRVAAGVDYPDRESASGAYTCDPAASRANCSTVRRSRRRRVPLPARSCR